MNTPKTVVEIEPALAAKLKQVCRVFSLGSQLEHVVNVILAQEMRLLEEQPEMVQCLVEGVVYESETAARTGAIAALQVMTSGGKYLADGAGESQRVVVDWTGGQLCVDALDVGWPER